MTMLHSARRPRGFTLIELMIVIAVVAVILTLAAPSFYNFIVSQRLKAISAQLTTDVQLARSEAVGRNQAVRMRFSSSTADSCYAIYTGADDSCNCLNTPVCPTGSTEIRTVKVSRALGVSLSATPAYAFRVDPTNGSISINPIGISGGGADRFEVNVGADTARTLRTVISLSGRPTICVPSGSTMTGAPC
jgi:type IV fimbrial biogenesis protein FimT